MKNLLVVLSAAVLAGLGVYATFDWCNAFSLVGNNVMMRVDTFVAVVACLGIAGAGLALFLRAAVMRADRGITQALEDRIVRLEQGKPVSS